MHPEKSAELITHPAGNHLSFSLSPSLSHERKKEKYLSSRRGGHVFRHRAREFSFHASPREGKHSNNKTRARLYNGAYDRSSTSEWKATRERFGFLHDECFLSGARSCNNRIYGDFSVTTVVVEFVKRLL